MCWRSIIAERTVLALAWAALHTPKLHRATHKRGTIVTQLVLKNKDDTEMPNMVLSVFFVMSKKTKALINIPAGHFYFSKPLETAQKPPIQILGSLGRP